LRFFFEQVTGIKLGMSDDFGSHSMSVGHFLKPHDDDNRNRRLALVLYLSPDWESAYGGSLHIIDQGGSETVVPATYNSLVAFDTRAGTTHYVAPIAESAGDRRRVTIGGWYHEPD
jgi:Rps23 Pro-64 3,4-dihydroxylase Tpa1-like proline 4-hydroxylase